MSQQKKTSTLKRRLRAFKSFPCPESPEKKIFKSLPGYLKYEAIPAKRACKKVVQVSENDAEPQPINVAPPKSRLLQRRILVAKRASETRKRAFFLRFQQDELLGTGSFGKVFAGIRRKGQLPIAIKYIPKQNAQNITVGLNCTIPSEIYFHRKLDHPNIIKLLEHHFFDGHHVLVLERPRDCTDLFEHLVSHENNSISEEEARPIFRQIVRAVVYLDEHGILHNDLKPENVLLDLSENKKVKLIDFGLAWSIRNKPIERFSGTPEFCPPEYHINREYDGRQATVWSLGCFLFDMLTGNPPYLNGSDAASRPLELPSNLSQDAQGILGAMLQPRPCDRTRVQDLLGYSWLAATRENRSQT